MSNVCSLCHKNPTQLNCGMCGCDVCKYCAQILEADAFALMPVIPEQLKHGVYCPNCFDAHVADELGHYSATLEKARNVDCYFKTQGKESRLIRRVEKPVSIKDCLDKDELLLRLAFFAAKSNYNSLVDVELTSEKTGVGSYQRLKWRGTGVPAHASAKTVVHDKSIWHNPN